MDTYFKNALKHTDFHAFNGFFGIIYFIKNGAVKKQQKKIEVHRFVRSSIFFCGLFSNFRQKLIKKSTLPQTDKKFIQFPSVCLASFNFFYAASIALFFFNGIHAD